MDGVALIIILGVALVMGYMGYRYGVPNQSTQSRPTASNSPKPKRRNASTSRSSPNFFIRVRENGLDQLDQATLIASSRLARDEFLGSVDIIAGHHETPPQYSAYTAPKSWTFVGDVNGSDPLFEQEVQTIITELENNGWKFKPIPKQGRTTMWLMSR